MQLYSWFSASRDFAYSVLGMVAFMLVTASMATAQNVDPEELARASRDKLAAEIAAVDGKELRARLINLTEDRTLAQWYAGELQIDGRWLTLQEAQQAGVGDDETWGEYRELRTQATDHPRDHERLARWCDKNGLSKNAEMHWLHVLRLEGSNKAALKALELTWHDGLLMTHQEAKQYKAKEKSRQKQLQAWKGEAKRLRRNLEHDDPEKQAVARKAIREIRQPEAIPALLEEFGETAADEEKTIARRTELVSALNSIGSPESLELMAEIAIDAPNKAVRYEAMNQLKARPYQKYIPYLVSSMEMPIEASASYDQVGNRIVNRYSYAQDTPYGKRESTEYSHRRVPGQRYLLVDLHRYRVKTVTKHVPAFHRPEMDCNGHIVPAVNRPAYSYKQKTVSRSYAGTAHFELPDYQARRNRTLNRSKADAVRVGNKIAQMNQMKTERNERIADVLMEVTGEQLDAFPKSWWNWWAGHLERHPDVATEGTRQQLNAALLNQQQRGLARGTWVWTREGKRPIESIMPGDYVLAQEPSSGELAYKIVMASSSPFRMNVSKVETGDAQLFCAPGHVVWATGSGWKRVSHLEEGKSIHGAKTEADVSSLGEAFEIESYDLIVDGFHTFFVGEQGLLVHDGTPIGPTYGALPGFSPAAVANAAKLAAN